MSRQSVLIPLHDFNAGGTEAIAFRLAEAWLAAGWRTTILAGANDGPMRHRIPKGAEVLVLDPPRPRSAVSRFYLGKPMARLALQLAPDIIFIPGNFHFVLARMLKKAMPGVPIVAKISNPLLPGNLPPMTPFHRLALNWWTLGIDCFVAMAPSLAEHAARAMPMAQIIAIADPFLSDDPLERSREGRPGDSQPLRLLAIGRLEPQKDFRLALDVLFALRKQRPVTLTILGEGGQRALLEKRIAALGLAEWVHLAGHVNPIAPWLQEHDLLLMTSRFEGVPAVIGEALQQGVPFVSTDCTPWLTALSNAEPSVGTIATSRTPEALVQAIDTQCAQSYPTADAIERAIGAHRIGWSASRYLALFEALLSMSPPCSP